MKVINKDNKVIILSHFCKKRSNKEYIKYFKTIIDQYMTRLY